MQYHYNYVLINFVQIYSFLDITVGVILLTQCRGNFSGSRVHSQIPADVTFIDTRHEFPLSSVHFVDVEAGLSRPLSRRHNRIFHASLPRSSSFFFYFFFFCRISLSKPVIVVDEHASCMRTRLTLRLMASYTGCPLNPSILVGNSFSRLPEREVSW